MAADYPGPPETATTRLLGPDLLLGLDHVGVAVLDLDTGIAFQTDTFGWRLVHREDNAAQGVREAMLAAPGGGADAAQLQLLAPLGDQSPIGRFLERSGPGVQHVAYRVADLERASRVLRYRGLRLLYDRPQIGTRGSLINFIHPRDAGGVLIELVQAAPLAAAEHGDEKPRPNDR